MGGEQTTDEASCLLINYLHGSLHFFVPPTLHREDLLMQQRWPRRKTQRSRCCARPYGGKKLDRKTSGEEKRPHRAGAAIREAARPRLAQRRSIMAGGITHRKCPLHARMSKNNPKPLGCGASLPALSTEPWLAAPRLPSTGSGLNDGHGHDIQVRSACRETGLFRAPAIGELARFRGLGCGASLPALSTEPWVAAPRLPSTGLALKHGHGHTL